MSQEVIVFDPPPGFADLDSDAEDVAMTSKFQPLQVEGVGVVLARKPMPKSIPNLSAAANAKISDRARAGHHNFFLRNHLADGELDRLLDGMMTGEFPADCMHQVSRAITTWGTARPTSPSLTSRF